VRRTKQLSEIVGLDPHTQEILTNEVFRWIPKDDSFKYSGVSYVLERIQVEQGRTAEEMRTELANRVEIIKYLIRHDIRDFRDVGGIVSTYYKDPEELMAIVREDRPWRTKA
jgi:flagellar protein FlaI